MTLYNFKKWLEKNHPNDLKTKKRIEEYYNWKSAPLNKLIKLCPWIKEKNTAFGSDGICFTKMQIKELIDLGYMIEVSQNVNRDNNYNYSCMPYDYDLSITISKEGREVLEIYSHDVEPFYYVLNNFEVFRNVEGVKIYDND